MSWLQVRFLTPPVSPASLARRRQHGADPRVTWTPPARWVSLDIAVCVDIYNIDTIFYRRRSRSPRRPRQRPVLVEAETGELEAEDQVFPYLDTEKKEWFLAAAANNVTTTTLAIIDIY